MVQILNNASLSLIDRIQSDIRDYGDEKTFHAVWRQVSPESVELVDYLPAEGVQSEPNDIRELVHAMRRSHDLSGLPTPT